MLKSMRYLAVVAAMVGSAYAGAAGAGAPGWHTRYINGLWYGWYSAQPNIVYIQTPSGWIPSATYIAQLRQLQLVKAQLQQRLAQLQAQQQAQQQAKGTISISPGNIDVTGVGAANAAANGLGDAMARGGAVIGGGAGGTGGYEQPWCIDPQRPTYRIRCDLVRR